jgi:hypothetical protein
MIISMVIALIVIAQIQEDIYKMSNYKKIVKLQGPLFNVNIEDTQNLNDQEKKIFFNTSSFHLQQLLSMEENIHLIRNNFDKDDFLVMNNNTNEIHAYDWGLGTQHALLTSLENKAKKEMYKDIEQGAEVITNDA